MPMLAESTVPEHYQRRIGHRHPIRVPITWSLDRAKRLHRRPKPISATTANVSLTGIGFESVEVEVFRGAPIHISFGDTTYLGAVRSVRPGTIPGQRYYGVELQDRAAVDHVTALIAEHRRATGEADENGVEQSAPELASET